MNDFDPLLGGDEEEDSQTASDTPKEAPTEEDTEKDTEKDKEVSGEFFNQPSPSLSRKFRRENRAQINQSQAQDTIEESKSENREWVNIRIPWSRRKRLIAVLSGVIAILLIVSALAGIWLQRQLNPPGPEGEDVSVEIPEGASINDISDILSDSEVVVNRTVTRFWWRNEGPFQAGNYVFRENMSLSSAKSVLESGPLPGNSINITLPPGLWLSDIEQRLLAKLPEFNAEELNVALRGNVVRSRYQPQDQPGARNLLEGLLFPDTYNLDESSATNEESFVKRLVEQFDSVAESLGYDQALQKTGYSPYQVIIIASMVEEEARVAEDRAKIAQVIYNRLENGISLGIDATVLYALDEHKSGLTNEELDIDSPFNTRKYRGLPPTPIATPSRASLEAALNPEEGPWLYYVLASADGSHFFTDSYDEFLRQSNISREEGLFE